ncbi:hypothetical protein APICC_01436 [Apis cerana cerana]|uniref:Uncharacterized protein n=1 Tax=Apis cerana cerana TaxID=94128 RepID=A0A2A3E4Z1_APICC|nr:hypothetical protein APICC_01436 [Apis cerana cerana]
MLMCYTAETSVLATKHSFANIRYAMPREGRGRGGECDSVGEGKRAAGGGNGGGDEAGGEGGGGSVGGNGGGDDGGGGGGGEIEKQEETIKVDANDKEKMIDPEAAIRTSKMV